MSESAVADVSSPSWRPQFRVNDMVTVDQGTYKTVKLNNRPWRGRCRVYWEREYIQWEIYIQTEVKGDMLRKTIWGKKCHSSFFFPISSFFFPISSFFFPSSLFFLVSSFLFLLSSVFFLLSHFFFPISSFFFVLSSLSFVLSSVLFLLSSFFLLFSFFSLLSLYFNFVLSLLRHILPCHSLLSILTIVIIPYF